MVKMPSKGNINKVTGEILQNVLDKLSRGLTPKEIEYEEKVSQCTISKIKNAHPLLFWNKDKSS